MNAKRSEDHPVVLGLAADLIFASRIRATAEAAGVSAGTVRSPEDLLSRAIEVRPRLILVDLEVRRGDPADAIRRIREDQRLSGTRVVAFSSHTNREAIEAGREAGAEVFARSGFVRALPELLADAAHES